MRRNYKKITRFDKDCRHADNLQHGFNTKPFYELPQMVDLDTGEIMYGLLNEEA